MTQNKEYKEVKRVGAGKTVGKKQRKIQSLNRDKLLFVYSKWDWKPSDEGPPIQVQNYLINISH